MWPEFVHHVTSHFAIVLPMVLAGLGLYSLRRDDSVLIEIIRWGGDATLVLTAITAATGLYAGGFTGGEEHLQHHRYLGVLTLITAGIAAVSYDRGAARDIGDLRQFGVAVWWVTAFATIGAGHWGVLGEHADIVPF